MKTHKELNIEILEVEVQQDIAPKVSKAKLTPNEKLLRKAIRYWARDSIINHNVSETNQAAILAGFHYALNLMFEIAELRDKAKTEGTDTKNMTFENALTEIERMMNHDSYACTVLGHLRQIAVRKGLL
jgi:hypothetical protein